MASVSLHGLTKLYRASQSGVRSISLDIEDGEHLLLVGPSGAGKTTILRLIAGLERAETGSIEIAGLDATSLPPHRRRVALVAQRPALYPHLTVRHNLAAGIEFRQTRSWLGRHRESPTVSTEELSARVETVAEILGLTALLDRQPRHLSGGEQQRVALGRAWVSQAAVWLLDEPLAHLDPELQLTIRGELHLLRDRLKATIIEVTHDPVEALAHRQRVAVLRDGRLEQVGLASELYRRPVSRIVASALGGPPINLADAVVSGDGGRLALRTSSGWSLPFPADRTASPDRSVTFGVRPEHIMPWVASNGGDGRLPLGDWTVTRAEPRGPAWLLTVVRPGVSWRTWWPESPAASVLSLAVPAEAFYVFDRRSGETLGPTEIAECENREEAGI